MSKGTRSYPVRISDEMAQEIKVAIDQRNMYSKESGWTFSDFIRKAIKEKLAHMKRSREKKPRPEIIEAIKAIGGVE